MLRVNRSLVNSIDGGEIYDSIAKVDVSNAEAINTIAPTFSNITGSNNVSVDATGDIQLADVFTVGMNASYQVYQAYADQFLVGQGWNGSDIASAFYFTPSALTVTGATANYNYSVIAGAVSLNSASADTVKVIRGSVQILNGQTTRTLTNGVDYTLEDTDDTKWYFRITSNHFTGMGVVSGGGSQNPDDFTVHAVQSGANVVLTRSGNSNDTRVDSEIVQYTGNTPANEFIVREKGELTLSSGTTSTTTNLPACVVNANDVVILITGQSTSPSTRNDTHTMLFTAARGSTDWTATRGKNNAAATISYAVIEYTGSDYTVTQQSFNVSSATATETLTTPVTDASKTFIHAQYRYDSTGSAGLDDASVRVYLQDSSTLAVFNATSTDLSLKQNHVYLIENDNLVVNRYIGEMSGETTGEEEIDDVAVTTVANSDLTTLFGLTASSTGSGTAFPRGFVNFTLSADDNVKLRQSDEGQTSLYSFEVVEWPAASGGQIDVTGQTANYDYDAVSGAVELTGSIDVSGQTAAYNYQALNGAVDLTGSIDVQGQTATYNYSALPGAVDLTAQLQIVGQTAGYNYAALTGAIDLTGQIDVTGQTASFNYNAIAGTIDTTGAIQVQGATANYNYAAVAGLVSLVGEIEVTGQTASYNYQSIPAIVDLTGSIDVQGQTAIYNYQALQGSISLTTTIDVVGNTAQYSYAAVSGQVDLTPTITVVGTTANYSYNALSGLVDLTGEIVIVGETANYAYNAISGNAQLFGEIIISGQTANYNYAPVAGSVTLQTQQDLSNITAGYAQSIYGAEYEKSAYDARYKINSITVRYK